jgi:hypothetical protein
MQPPLAPGGARPAQPARPASVWLGDTVEYRTLAAQARRFVEIARLLAEIEPRQPVQVLGFADGTLRLACRNASEAARLRQFEPRLVARLRQSGVAVERLHIRTQRGLPLGQGSSHNRGLAARGPMPDSALTGLAGLTAQLPPGRLNAALARLLARERRQRR